MFKLTQWNKFFAFLCMVGLMSACTADDTNMSGSTSEPIVAFAFTPEPTSTRPIDGEQATEGGLAINDFSVSIDNPTATDAPIVAVDDSVLQPSDSPTGEAPVTAIEREESALASKRVDLADRITLESSITGSRNAISNLTYTINVASGVGMLSCKQTLQYFDEIVLYQQYNVSAEHEIAHEHYSIAIDAVSFGVDPLADFCENYLDESSYNDELPVRDIQPVAVWEQAVAESNTALRSAENAVGWLKGDARFLTSILDNTQLEIDAYRNAIANPVAENCPVIQQTFEKLVAHSTLLDPSRPAAVNSYSVYRQSINKVNETGLVLYEYCTGLTNGTQANNNESAGILASLAATASIGLEDVAPLMSMSYHYLLPPTPTPASAVVEAPTEQPIVAVEQTQNNTTTQNNTNNQGATAGSPILNVFIVSVQQSKQPHLWEIVVGFEAVGGTGPFTLQTGGILNNNNTVTIVQTCDRNFRDTLILTDVNGQRFQSNKIEVERVGVCGL